MCAFPEETTPRLWLAGSADQFDTLFLLVHNVYARACRALDRIVYIYLAFPPVTAGSLPSY